MTATEIPAVVPDVAGVYPWQDKVTPLLPGEVWKAHPELPFDVSTLGRIRSQKTGNLIGSLGPGSSQGKPYPLEKRYVQITIRKPDGRSTVTYAHSMVLETFVGPRPEGHEPDHIDHDRQNNRVGNLQWRLRRDNRADTWR